MTLAIALLVVVAVVTGVYWAGLVHRDVHIWFWSYLRRAAQLRCMPQLSGVQHVLFCFVDHYEPLAGGVDESRGLARVQRWTAAYEQFAARHRDSDGRPPLHTFFYPEEEYRPGLVGPVGELCKRGYGEIEVHLHHDNDTEEGLRKKIGGFLETLQHNHGAIARLGGKYRYAFIHGNWALDNSRADGRWCGINNELIVLRETGCYADFTLPSAPSDTQTRTVNTIYYATDDPHRPKSHDTGVPMRVGGQPSGDLLIFQGPLALHWKHRRLGIWPRIENADVAPCDIPIEERVDVWVKQHVHVLGRPEWLFIKVHTHGAIEPNADFLFGGELDRLHAYLGRRYNDGQSYRLHYVTAREAYNIAKAAEAGQTGDPGRYRDFVIPRPVGLSVSDKVSAQPRP